MAGITMNTPEQDARALISALKTYAMYFRKNKYGHWIFKKSLGRLRFVITTGRHIGIDIETKRKNFLGRTKECHTDYISDSTLWKYLEDRRNSIQESRKLSYRKTLLRALTCPSK